MPKKKEVLKTVEYEFIDGQLIKLDNVIEVHAMAGFIIIKFERLPVGYETLFLPANSVRQVALY